MSTSTAAVNIGILISLYQLFAIKLDDLGRHTQGIQSSSVKCKEVCTFLSNLRMTLYRFLYVLPYDHSTLSIRLYDVYSHQNYFGPSFKMPNKLFFMSTYLTVHLFSWFQLKQNPVFLFTPKLY